MTFGADIEALRALLTASRMTDDGGKIVDRDGAQDWVEDHGESLLAALDRLAAEHERLREGLRRIGYEMPVEERNPDGDEQAAYSMQLVARDLLAETALADTDGDA